MIRTHTKTYAVMTPWASTTPWPADISREVNGKDAARPGDPCEAEDCGEPLNAGEVYYHVTEMPRVGTHEPRVCWRHVRPDEGPATTSTGHVSGPAHGSQA